MLNPYESSQPPLFYLAAGTLGRLFSTDSQAMLYVGRLVSVLFGAGVVYFCWTATRQLAPRAPMWAVAVAGVVALLPQFCFNNITDGSDSAANFAAAASSYVWFRGLRSPNEDPWMILAGALIGLVFLSKLTAAALVPGLA